MQVLSQVPIPNLSSVPLQLPMPSQLLEPTPPQLTLEELLQKTQLLQPILNLLKLTPRQQKLKHLQQPPRQPRLVSQEMMPFQAPPPDPICPRNPRTGEHRSLRLQSLQWLCRNLRSIACWSSFHGLSAPRTRCNTYHPFPGGCRIHCN